VRKYIRIAVSVLLLTLIAWRTDWSEVGQKFAHLRVELWFAAVGLYLVAQVASARRWQLFAQELHFEHTLAQYCAYSLIGMFFSLLLPTLVGGDMMRVWYLNGQSGRKWAAIASVFLERINGLLILIATACIGVLISPVELPWWIVGSVWGSAACACLGVASLPILRRWQRLSLERREQVRIFIDVMRSPRVLLESSVLSILVQVAAVLILWCLGIGLGLDVPIAYYCVLVPMVSLLMLLPISVNGMGVREGGTVLFLLPFGVNESAALTLAFLWFTTGVAVSLIGGVVYLFGAYPKIVRAEAETQEALASN
jgi:uncharacterized membrane protein YbhN (UPF0104 family)